MFAHKIHVCSQYFMLVLRIWFYLFEIILGSQENDAQNFRSAYWLSWAAGTKQQQFFIQLIHSHTHHDSSTWTSTNLSPTSASTNRSPNSYQCPTSATFLYVFSKRHYTFTLFYFTVLWPYLSIIIWHCLSIFSLYVNFHLTLIILIVIDTELFKL